MRRSLIHYWRMNLAVLSAAAVTMAVLTGALIVGDSMRSSLRDLSLERLGRIQEAVLQPQFFPADLSSRLLDQLTQPDQAVIIPTILLQGTGTHHASQRRANGVQVVGITAEMAQLFPLGGEALAQQNLPGQVFPGVTINEALAAELDAAVGDDILLSLSRVSDVPSASLLGRRDHQDLVETLRLTVVGILPVRGVGRFALATHQAHPLNAFVELQVLQRRIDRRDQANALLVARGSDAAAPDPNLATLLQSSLTIEDLGVETVAHAEYVEITSREMVLRPELVSQVDELAREHGVKTWPVLTYLANRMQVGDRVLPYSTVSAVSLPPPAATGTMLSFEGESVEEIGAEEIFLTQWAADDLAARVGDELTMSFFVVDRNDALEVRQSTFQVAGILRQIGLAADPHLTPEVPGMSDVDDIASWDPPFPVDLSVVRPRDEEYWDLYRGAPKAFVSFDTGRRMWRSRYGEITSIRLVPPAETSPGALKQLYDAELPRRLPVTQAGFTILPVLADGVAAASGSTDFSQLFLGFSLFLIIAALMLSGLLFALLIERRAPEMGIRLAVGFTRRAVQVRLLIEGCVLACGGALLGAGLSASYASIVLNRLGSWWSPVVDAPFLHLYLLPGTLLTGGLASLLLVTLTMWRTTRRLTRLPETRLLVGSTAPTWAGLSARRPAIVAGVTLSIAAVALATAVLRGIDRSASLFFVIGAALLTAGVSAFVASGRRAAKQRSPDSSLQLLTLAYRNTARSPGRSLLCVALVAAASFVLVAVAANRKTHRASADDRTGGTGGFGVVAESDLPLPRPLDAILSDTHPQATGLADSVFALRLVPGDDASCLNLYQPESPRILGVPDDFIARGGFRFAAQLAPRQNPWELLDEDLGPNVVPAIGDANSLRWILHRDLGDEIEMIGDRGQLLRLRIVGMLTTSIFQSELLVSETRFLEHFPDHTGFSFFVAELPPDNLERYVELSEEALEEFGLDAGTTTARLMGYQAVETMYLSTFEALGGLGMILGTLGLGIVLWRNVLERHRELALLRAFGFTRSTLALTVVLENLLLLLAGVGIGSAAGLIAVAPSILTGAVEVPWISLTRTLAAMLAVGLSASIAAVVGAVRTPLLPALKSEV